MVTVPTFFCFCPSILGETLFDLIMSYQLLTSEISQSPKSAGDNTNCGTNSTGEGTWIIQCVIMKSPEAEAFFIGSQDVNSS